jgi:hypothetical protein
VENRLRRKETKYATAGILLTGCFLYFRFFTPYSLCFKEQIQLFVFSSPSLWEYFTKPAVLACLAGDYLTQFLYFKTGGALVVTLLLALEWRLVWLTLKRFYSIKPTLFSGEALFALSFLPVIVEWITLPHLHFSLSLSVSLIIALCTFIIYTELSGKIAFFACILLIPFLYVSAGASVFLFLALAVLYNRQQKFQCMTLLALTIVLPFILRHAYLLTLKQTFLYPFPDLLHGLGLAAAAFIVLLFVAFSGIRGVIIVIAWTIVLVTGLIQSTDRNQERLYGMIIEASHNQWDKILDIAGKTELKKPIAACYTNLALSQKNLLGERLMDFYQPFSSGLLLINKPDAGWLDIFSSCDTYYYIGDMEMAQHAALTGMLFSPNQRSARLVERLAEINLTTGDIPAATKYIRMLQSTLFHKIKPDMLSKDRPQKVYFREDTIRRAVDVKASLTLLAKSNPENLPAINYLLCFYLLNKDIPSFFEVYTTYYKGAVAHASNSAPASNPISNPASNPAPPPASNPAPAPAPVPKVYAEALLIYFAASKSPVEKLLEYGIHPDMIQQFSEYTRIYEASNGSLAAVQPAFSNTYWVFYHFAITK